MWGGGGAFGAGEVCSPAHKWGWAGGGGSEEWATKATEVFQQIALLALRGCSAEDITGVPCAGDAA